MGLSGLPAAVYASAPEDERVTDQAWLETNRGTVFAWEVDNVGHFTVAYWFDRFEDAGLGFLDALGLGADALRARGQACVTTDCHVRYLRELRVSDVFHVVTGVIGGDDASLVLGHKVIDSATGTVCGTLEQTVAHVDAERGAPVPLAPSERRTAAAHRVSWDGPPRERRIRPGDLTGFIDGARDTVKPWEMAVTRRSALRYYIHRFSAAGGHLLAAFGMTPGYMRDERRGLSTFEFQLGLAGPLVPGMTVRVKTALLHVGNSSLHLFHHLHDTRTGAEIATLHQLGVHLDMDARRPAPLPQALRDKARGLLVPAGA